MNKIYIGFNPNENNLKLRIVVRDLIRALKKKKWQVLIPSTPWVRIQKISQINLNGETKDGKHCPDVCVFLMSPVGKIDSVMSGQITRFRSISRSHGFIVTDELFCSRGKVVPEASFTIFRSAGVEVSNAVHSYHCILDWITHRFD